MNAVWAPIGDPVAEPQNGGLQMWPGWGEFQLTGDTDNFVDSVREGFTRRREQPYRRDLEERAHLLEWAAALEAEGIWADPLRYVAEHARRIQISERSLFGSHSDRTDDPEGAFQSLLNTISVVHPALDTSDEVARLIAVIYHEGLHMVIQNEGIELPAEWVSMYEGAPLRTGGQVHPASAAAYAEEALAFQLESTVEWVLRERFGTTGSFEYRTTNVAYGFGWNVFHEVENTFTSLDMLGATLQILGVEE